MSEKPISREKPVLVPRGDKIQVWHTQPGEYSASGNQIAVGQAKEFVKGEKGFPEKGLPESVLADENQQELARELSDRPLRGDIIPVKHEGEIKNVTVGDIYDHPSGGKYVGVFDQDGNHLGMNMEDVFTSQETRDHLAQLQKFDEVKRLTQEAVAASGGPSEPSAELVSAMSGDTSDSYDDLFNPNHEYGSVQDAAVPETEDQRAARLTRERRQRDEVDAFLAKQGRPEMN